MTQEQKFQLDILCKLDEVCRRNCLVYYLAYGTCIGAVREKGFIPWDHDIDVLMPFDDAKRLEDLQNEFGKQYIVTSYRTDANFGATSMRIEDIDHKCVVKKHGEVIKTANLSIDIYPFYNCPPTKFGLKARILYSHLYKLLVGGVPQNHGTLMKSVAKIVLAFFPQKNRKRDIARCENFLNYKGNSTEIADYFGLDVTFFNAITYKKEWFSRPQELEFEGHFFYGPTDTDKYLTKRYGDYMTPIDPSKRAEEAVIEML